MKIEAASALVTRWLGRMAFPEALELQENIVARKRREPRVSDELLLLEHEPVYTIGRTPDQSSLRGANHLPYRLFEINRGGQATYHGPGQLVGYFLLDLRRYGQDLHRYLRWIEMVLVELLAQYELSATTRDGLTGLWVEDPEMIGVRRKIASIGVGVRHWITMHGFALNVSGDLSPFDHIIPCGIAGVTMTSIEKETGIALAVEDVGRRMATVAEDKLRQLIRSF
jgi:lipoyl(octanoyl) transferase